jgi:hypothetical protein
MIKKVFMMFVGVALMALPTMAQTFETQKIEQPNAVFQSTSALQGSGSQYSANPMLNADGTASYNGAAASTPSSPYRAKKDGTGTTPNPGDPSEEEQDNTPTPLGDAVLPLMLMAGAFGMFVYFRRKRSEA